MDPLITHLILKDRRVGYLIVDHDLHLIEINDPLSLFLEDNQTTLPQASLWDLVPELIGNEDMVAAILAGETPRFQLNWVNRDTLDGQPLYLTMVDLPYRDQTGQIIGLIHLFDDVTETGTLHQELTQHHNELQLLQHQLVKQKLELAAANTELQQLSDMKSTFVSIAAHELRTPLTAISGYVELLLEEDDPLTEDQRASLVVIDRSSDRLMKITKNLLDVTRIEIGRIELVLQSVILSPLLEGIIAELNPLFKAKKQRLTLHIEPNLPLALCDETRTMQIINNLLSNASKYTPPEGLIQVRLELDDEEGFLRILVQDNGIGISAQDQASLFKLFFRAGNVGVTGATGTGLGLYITRSLVELQGGRIWLESELNKGSTFYVTFPVAD